MSTSAALTLGRGNRTAIHCGALDVILFVDSNVLAILILGQKQIVHNKEMKIYSVNLQSVGSEDLESMQKYATPILIPKFIKQNIKIKEAKPC